MKYISFIFFNIRYFLQCFKQVVDTCFNKGRKIRLYPCFSLSETREAPIYKKLGYICRQQTRCFILILNVMKKHAFYCKTLPVIFLSGIICSVPLTEARAEKTDMEIVQQQSVKITGKVVDAADEPVIGASVTVKG
ncbi:hypothetical protein M145_0337, partial [Bacteroides fragilis str. 34-F-2 